MLDTRLDIINAAVQYEKGEIQEKLKQKCQKGPQKL
jgi:hypothetical protein